MDGIGSTEDLLSESKHFTVQAAFRKSKIDEWIEAHIV